MADTTTPTIEPTTAPVAAKRPRWQRWLGLKPRQGGRYLKVTPTAWGWILMVLVVGGAAMGGFAEYSMQPDFCRSCHIMEPYYQAWHTSTHKNVPCADCHFEPGLANTLRGKFQASSQAVKYITETYGSKPHAEVRDESCMRSGCHERRLLEGKVDWDVPSTRGGTVKVRFDHAPHLQPDRRGKQLRCVSCHSQMVQGQHITVTVDTCFLCHFKGKEHGRNEEALGGCNSCHDAPKDQIRLATGMFNHKEYVDREVGCNNCHSDAVKGDGEVPRQVCWNCHNQSKQVARYGETAFMHANHVTKHKVECASCHVQIEHHLTAGAAFEQKMPAGQGHAVVQSGTCGQCHVQAHGGPAEMYKGTGGKGVPDMPSNMFRSQVDCIACHKGKQNSSEVATVAGQTFTGTQESCNACHAAKYDGTLDQWKKTVAEHLARAEAARADAEAALKAAGVSGMVELNARRLLDEADHNIRFVKYGQGVHNVNYATALLSVAVERCDEARKLVGKSAAAGGQP